MRMMLRSEYLELSNNRKATSVIQKNGSSGCYAFFDESGKCLYVGWARSLAERISGHFGGRSNTSKISGMFFKVLIYNEIDMAKGLKIYGVQDFERWLISWMRPVFNKQFVF